MKLKIKNDYVIKKMGEGFVVVTVGQASKEFNGMMRLNEVGAFIWKQLETGATEEELLQRMLERYDDLDENTAREDLEEMLEKIDIALEKKLRLHTELNKLSAL